jgi:hypothetical protein
LGGRVISPKVRIPQGFPSAHTTPREVFVWLLRGEGRSPAGLRRPARPSPLRSARRPTAGKLQPGAGQGRAKERLFPAPPRLACGCGFPRGPHGIWRGADGGFRGPSSSRGMGIPGESAEGSPSGDSSGRRGGPMTGAGPGGRSHRSCRGRRRPSGAQPSESAGRNTAVGGDEGDPRG